MATQLELYNQALLLLGSRTIATLTDNRAERRTLDSVYDATFNYMIEAAMWHFAARSTEIDAETTALTGVGWDYEFEKPDDYVRLMKISDNESLSPTLSAFGEEGNLLLANCDPIYIQYVSDDTTDGGGDLTRWSASFETAFIDELAYRAAPQIQHVPPTLRDWLAKKKRISLAYAKGKSAVNQSASFLPTGRLVRARAGSRFKGDQRRTSYD